MGGNPVEGALCHAGDDPGLRLIETLHWTGREARLLDLHLARLARGAAALGWANPTETARQQLAGLPETPQRLRLDLDRRGHVSRQIAPLPPVAAVWRVGLASERLCSCDPWLRIKSNRRAAYDAARAGLSPGLDEVILQNERGEICDGSITTVFFDRGAGMRTPPLSAGLLPGILRQSLRLPEETLLASEVANVRLWVGNALRGLIPATFVAA